VAKPLNKYTVHEHIIALEREMGDLKRLVQAIELKPGPEGRPGTTGQAGQDGKTVIGPQGPPGLNSTVPGPAGPAGQSIRGEKGDPGPDTAVVLAEVKQALAELRGLVEPLNAEFHRHLKAQADASEFRLKAIASRPTVFERVKKP